MSTVVVADTELKKDFRPLNGLEVKDFAVERAKRIAKGMLLRALAQLDNPEFDAEITEKLSQHSCFDMSQSYPSLLMSVQVTVKARPKEKQPVAKYACAMDVPVVVATSVNGEEIVADVAEMVESIVAETGMVGRQDLVAGTKVENAVDRVREEIKEAGKERDLRGKFISKNKTKG